MDVDALFEDPEVDAIVIATPVFTHFDLASQRARRRQARVRREAARAIDRDGHRPPPPRAIHSELLLMCGHTFVYSPPVRAIKGLLDIDELGEVFFVSSNRVNLGLHRRDISVIWDLGPHDFSILLYLLGEMPRRVRAVGSRLDRLRHPRRGLRDLGLRVGDRCQRRAELACAQQAAADRHRRAARRWSSTTTVPPSRFGSSTTGSIYRDPETFGEYHLSYRTGDILSPHIGTHEPLVEELDDFVSAIRFGHEPEASPSLARHVVELAEAADESLRRRWRGDRGRPHRALRGSGLETRGARDQGGAVTGESVDLRRAGHGGSPVLGERCRGDTNERVGVRRWVRGRRDVATRRVLAGADLAAIVAAMAVSQFVVTPQAEALRSFLLGLLTLPIWIALFNVYGLYDRDSKRISYSTVDDFPRLFHSLVIGSLGLWAYSKLVFPHRLELTQGVSFFALSLFGILAARAVGRGLLASRVRRERALLVGDGPIAGVIERKIECHPEYGLDLIGRVGPSAKESEGIDPVSGNGATASVLGSASALEGIDRVVVVTAGMDDESVLELLRRSSDLDIKVSLIPNLVEAIGSAVEVDDLEGITVLGINPPTLARSSRLMKRSMDVAVAFTVLLLALPVMLVAAVAIKLTSAGPILFTQERVGRGGRRFRIYKFRTMFKDAEERAAELRKLSAHSAWLLLEDDPRITRVGRILRRTSIDELPQLLNVVRGDMSLVGPRPMTPEVDQFIDGWGRRRLDLTPGITGLWQVLGRTSIPFEEMVNLDYLYVTNWSLWQDIRLLIRTLPAVAARRGAN